MDLCKKLLLAIYRSAVLVTKSLTILIVFHLYLTILSQNSSTAQMIFPVPELVSWVSKLTTLLPGDIILTGTPPGVGVFQKPPQFLQPGDVVQCYVENIGTISNRVV